MRSVCADTLLIHGLWAWDVRSWGVQRDGSIHGSSWELLRRLRLLPCSQNVQSCYCKLECVIRGDELLDLTCKLGFLVGKCVTSLANMQGQIIHIYFGNTLPFRLLNWASAKGMERGLRDSWHEGLCVFMNVNNQKSFCNENPDCLLGLMIACLNIFA